MTPVKVRYVSDYPSFFFKKGEIYDGYRDNNHPKLALVLFYFTEEEMDEAGYYGLPLSWFEIID